MKRRTPTRQWVVRIAAGVAAAVVAAAIGYGFMPKPLVVDVAEVTRGPLRVTLDGEGKTRVRDRFVVSAPVAGVVSRIELDPGDAVKQNSVVAYVRPTRSALLDPQARAAAIASAESANDAQWQAAASIDRSAALLDVARETAARVEKRFAAGKITRQKRDEAWAEVRVREAELSSAWFGAQVAAHQMDSARAVLGMYRGIPTETVPLTSPIDGVVLRVVQESEAPVAIGAPLAEVGDVTKLDVVASLLTRDAVAVHAGMRATLDGWGGDRTIDAQVRRVEPAAFTDVSALGVREQRVNVVLDIDDASAASALGDGYAVDVHFIAFEAPAVLRVPLSALFRHGNSFAVFTVIKNRARLTPVQVGHMSATDAEVIAGLAGSETVVVHPGDAVHAGQSVRVRS